MKVLKKSVRGNFWARTSLTYGLPAWGQAGKMYLNKILILQKRALRLLFFADVRDHAIPLFLEANVLPITFLYHECVASLMYDINSNNAPINMLHLFKETSSVHSIIHLWEPLCSKL